MRKLLFWLSPAVAFGGGILVLCGIFYQNEPWFITGLVLAATGLVGMGLYELIRRGPR